MTQPCSFFKCATHGNLALWMCTMMCTMMCNIKIVEAAFLSEFTRPLELSFDQIGKR